MDYSTPAKMLKVCSGHGCKAWDSEKILAMVRESVNHSDDPKNTCISAVSCMNKCGGGVSVEMLPSGESLKLRKPNEILKVLNLPK